MSAVSGNDATLSTISPVSLVSITFKVDTMGASNLTLYDTKLLDPSGAFTPHETGDGFFQSLVRDVAVIYVAPHLNKIYEGWKVNITVIVKNEGDIPETFDVIVYHNYTVIATQTVTNLRSGENMTFLFQWDTDGLAPCQNYTIRAEAEHLTYEIDLTDNTYVDGLVKIKIMGDLNEDGIVDTYDLAVAAVAFGSSPGHPNWNLEADLDQNSIIDLYDIVRITINYGRTC